MTEDKARVNCDRVVSIFSSICTVFKHLLNIYFKTQERFMIHQKVTNAWGLLEEAVARRRHA